jgi:hypothetical protein
MFCRFSSINPEKPREARRRRFADRRRLVA